MALTILLQSNKPGSVGDHIERIGRKTKCSNLVNCNQLSFCVVKSTAYSWILSFAHEHHYSCVTLLSYKQIFLNQDLM